MMLTKRSRVIIAILAVLLVGGLVWLLVDRAQKTATINVTITPESSQITIDGKQASSSNRIRPGAYVVSVEKEGFHSYEESVDVGSNEVIDLYVALEPSSDETQGWYDENPEDAGALERVLDNQYTQEATTITENFPVISILPYIAPRGAYTINYGLSQQADTQAIYISYYTDVGRDLALQYIRDNGFNPDDYEIIYEKMEIGQ